MSDAAEIDEEILEIFVEEADEAIETIDAQLSEWRQDASKQDALEEMRRAFHTLKGSGRMVGAETVGELAGSIENVLNKVIDGTVTTTPSVFEAVDRARTLMPDVVAHFAGQGGFDEPAVRALQEGADKLARNEPHSFEAAIAEIETAEPEPESEPTEVTIERVVAPESIETLIEEAVAPESIEVPTEEAVAPESIEVPTEEAVAPESIEVSIEAAAPESIEALIEEAVAPESIEAPIEEAVAPESIEAPIEEAVAPESIEAPIEEAVAPESIEAPIEEAASPESTEAPAKEAAAPETVDIFSSEEVEFESIEIPTEEPVSVDTLEISSEEEVELESIEIPVGGDVSPETVEVSAKEAVTPEPIEIPAAEAAPSEPRQTPAEETVTPEWLNVPTEQQVSASLMSYTRFFAIVVPAWLAVLFLSPPNGFAEPDSLVSSVSGSVAMGLFILAISSIPALLVWSPIKLFSSKQTSYKGVLAVTFACISALMLAAAWVAHLVLAAQ